MKKLVMQLEQLTCPTCVKKIETVLGKTEGVDTSTVLFNSSKVKISYNEEEVTPNELSRKIMNLGYAVLSMKE